MRTTHSVGSGHGHHQSRFGQSIPVSPFDVKKTTQARPLLFFFFFFTERPEPAAAPVSLQFESTIFGLCLMLPVWLSPCLFLWLALALPLSHSLTNSLPPLLFKRPWLASELCSGSSLTRSCSPKGESARICKGRVYIHTHIRSVYICIYIYIYIYISVRVCVW